MNYRHEFHAGNFADVFKHIILTRALLHLKMKPAPFRYIETHAGGGLYDLMAPEAGKPAEWQGGIGRACAAAIPPTVKPLLEDYLSVETPLYTGRPHRYGGSPEIARSLLRRHDRILLCELYPPAASALRASVRDKRAKIFEMDGYAALKAFLPPVERRGLILIDPPFEAPEEFTSALDAIEMAHRKFATGTILFWYPVKDTEAAAEMAADLKRRKIRRVLRIELQIDTPKHLGPLARCGLIVVNPPYLLDWEAELLIPWLADLLSAGRPGYLVEWLSGA
ncbi:MAG TPA: 23S rRNA (adenine(2030)-N(6))-methyltransferase RlmJ [Methylocella sp.]|nr:23S rRNA (adenine(2030)-N(6))-methyltransferase RlmJ [Methylocella sp.]